jgi:hypothetical protein
MEQVVESTVGSLFEDFLEQKVWLCKPCRFMMSFFLLLRRFQLLVYFSEIYAVLEAVVPSQIKHFLVLVSHPKV